MSYNRVNWKDATDEKTTPINAANLNIMDKGIKDNDTAITNLGGTVGAMALSNIITEFTVDKDDWVASVADANYPKENVVTSSLYSSSFIPVYIDMIPADGTAFFSDAETEAKGLLNQQVVFGANGFTVYASDTPTVDIKLRICGVANAPTIL